MSSTGDAALAFLCKQHVEKALLMRKRLGTFTPEIAEMLDLYKRSAERIDSSRVEPLQRAGKPRKAMPVRSKALAVCRKNASRRVKPA